MLLTYAIPYLKALIEEISVVKYPHCLSVFFFFNKRATKFVRKI